MSPLVQTANLILSVLTILAQAGIVASLVLFFLQRNKQNPLLGVVAKYVLALSFIIALGATTGSLFYSEVAGFEPCKLCWFQRVFMYPQVVLLGLALVRRDARMGGYVVALSLLGALVASYHYLLQLGFAPALSCTAQGYSEACSQRFVMNFGYITIPLMAFTAFVSLITLQVVSRTPLEKKQNNA